MLHMCAHTCACSVKLNWFCTKQVHSNGLNIKFVVNSSKSWKDCWLLFACPFVRVRVLGTTVGKEVQRARNWLLQRQGQDWKEGKKEVGHWKGLGYHGVKSIAGVGAGVLRSSLHSLQHSPMCPVWALLQLVERKLSSDRRRSCPSCFHFSRVCIPLQLHFSVKSEGSKFT